MKLPYLTAFVRSLKTLAKGASLITLAALISLSGFFVPAHAAVAALGVTQITAVQTFAVADNTFEHGWKWVFDVTVPTGQTYLQMKFADWVSGSNSIPAGGNIRFYSTESTNATNEGSALLITDANTYSDLMYINPAVDLDTFAGGRQIEVTVEARVPTGSAGGSYSTSYGINTTAPAQVTVSDLVQTYNAAPRAVTVVTAPIGLATKVTYNGSTEVPVHAGTYTVDVVVTDPGYTGTSTATLLINPAPVTATANAQTKVFGTDDPALTYTVVGDLFGTDAFTGALTRDEGEDVGDYAITKGTLALSSDYVLTFVPGTFSITPAHADITLGNLNQSYDKTGKSVSVTTEPVGLTTNVTYDGSADLPINAGTYAVHAVITDPNYEGTADESLVIEQAQLTVTAQPDTRVYTANTLSSVKPIITAGQLFVGDSAVLSQTFDTKDVGTGKTLTPGAVITDGNNGHNYAVALEDTTDGEITPAAVTVTAVGHVKSYDGTTDATVDLHVSGAVGGDNLTATGDAQFEDKNAGPDKPINVTNIIVTGSDVTPEDYVYNTTASTTATINQKDLQVKANDLSKVYGDTFTFDGTEFTTSALAPDESIESVTLTSDGAAPTAPVAPYDIHIGNAVGASGTDVANYNISYVDGVLTVTPKNLTATFTAADKTYDGTDTATTTSCTLAGVANNDPVTCTAVNAHFTNKNAGPRNKNVTANIILSDEINYTVTSPVTISNLAKINPRPLTLTAQIDSKTYDGTASSSKPSIIDPATALVDGDTADLSQEFDSPNVGSRTLIPSITLHDGNSGKNYAVTKVNAEGQITPVSVTVTAEGVNKIYDGTTDATVTLHVDGAVHGDELNATYTKATIVCLNSGSCGDVGSYPVAVQGIALTGSAAGNYTSNPTATAHITITPKPLTIAGITIAPRPYDGTATAILGGSPQLQGVVSPDVITLDGSVVQASFADKNVGTGKPVTLTGNYIISGVKAHNYSLTQPTGLTGDIAALHLASTLSADGKTYNGTTDATATCTVMGMIGGDDLSCVAAHAHFDTRNAIAQHVTADISLAGTDAGNYSVDPTASTDATIEKLSITVTAEPNTKVYDGTPSAAALPTVSPDVVTGDTANFIESYLTPDAGENKTLKPSGTVNDGNNGDNYDYQFIDNETGIITKADQIITIDQHSIPSGPVDGHTFRLLASASSNLGLVFHSNTNAVCTVDPNSGVVSLVTDGTCHIVVDQGGNNNYNPASAFIEFLVQFFLGH